MIPGVRLAHRFILMPFLSGDVHLAVTEGSYLCLNVMVEENDTTIHSCAFALY